MVSGEREEKRRQLCTKRPSLSRQRALFDKRIQKDREMIQVWIYHQGSYGPPTAVGLESDGLGNTCLTVGFPTMKHNFFFFLFF